MCGIAGIIFNEQGPFDQSNQIVSQMNQTLTHRGPDHAGYYDDSRCSLAMRRLSIIDLKTGHQPIFNENKNILVFLNGEIYNYLSLKNHLEKKGHVFNTRSDTEALVHLYEEYGESMFDHLKGMYAFCLYDKTKDKFIIGRDPFGEKPLFYHYKDGLLSFSSEIKSLLENHSISREFNKEALPYYLRTSLVPEPLTMFKEVKSLRPGHFIKIEKMQLSVERHFVLNYEVNSDIKTKQDATDLIEPLLRDAVKSQSTSDVPLGAFLSGGIDSSTMVGLLQSQSVRSIDTFNVKFEDDAYDESAIARQVAQHFGTKHHEIVVPNCQFDEALFWDIIDHVGQPFRDSSAIPTYHVSREIGQYVKVAVSGDGGDELFGGYSMFQWYMKICRLKQLPPPVLNTCSGIINLLHKSPLFQNSTKIRQIHRAVSTACLNEKSIAIALNEMLTQAEILTLTSYDPSDITSFPLLKKYPDEYEHWSSLRKAMYYRAYHTLPSNMLVKVDRMSMANSLEVRAPFLDIDLFKASAQLPDEFLINEGKGKYLLREIMKDKLPQQVFNHPKQGFNLPLSKYQNDNFKALAHRLLFEENPFPGLFDEIQLKLIFDRGVSMKKDNHTISVYRATHQLWMMMQLFGWAIRFKVTY